MDTSSDRAHCGACDQACTRLDGECRDGFCRCPEAKPDFCPGENACVDLRSDLNFCGACNTPCTVRNAVCAAGSCVCPAQKPDHCVAQDLCTDLDTDRLHCGACGAVCAQGEVCSAGTCSAGSGLTCGGVGCPGDACCGTACQTTHSNGLGGTFWDCNPLGTYTMDSAASAADAWRPGAGDDLTGFPCANTLCLKREAGEQCALWCDNGTVTVSAPGSLVCLCAEQAPALTGNWD